MNHQEDHWYKMQIAFISVKERMHKAPQYINLYCVCIYPILSFSSTGCLCKAFLKGISLKWNANI